MTACFLSTLLAACSTVDTPKTASNAELETPPSQEAVANATAIPPEPINRIVANSEPIDLWERLRLGFDLTAYY